MAQGPVHREENLSTRTFPDGRQPRPRNPLGPQRPDCDQAPGGPLLAVPL